MVLHKAEPLWTLRTARGKGVTGSLLENNKTSLKKKFLEESSYEPADAAEKKQA